VTVRETYGLRPALACGTPAFCDDINRGPDHGYAAKRHFGRTGQSSLTPDGMAGPDTFMAMGLYELVLLKQGTRGDTVKKLQDKLGIAADGQFGSGTEKAVRDYQGKNGLVADGKAGPATLAHMKLFKEITD
jgi:hypothetical protein